MEVLGLDVKRKHVCQKHSERGRNILGGIGAEIARRVEWRLAALSRVLYTHFDPSFRGLPYATSSCAVAPWVRFRSSTSIAAAWRASAWVGAFVLPLVIFGMIEASITRRLSTPRTLSLAST